MPIQTLAELFLVASGYDKPDLLMHQVGGKYTSISTKQFVGDVHRLAKALRALGVQRGDRVALMAENGPRGSPWATAPTPPSSSAKRAAPSPTTSRRSSTPAARPATPRA